MFVDLKEKLRDYVEAFNASDDELYALIQRSEELAQVNASAVSQQ